MEFVAVFAVAVGVAILNSFPVIIQWLNNKPGEVFTGISHSFADYFLYTAQMAQGVSGRWVYSDQLFTNEAMAPTWYYWFNVTLGHMGSIAGLSPFAMYNVSLFFFVTLLCLVWYSLTKALYPTNRSLRLTSFLMILTATSFFSFARHRLAKLDFSQVEILGQFWFSPSPVFNRLGGVPYHVVQTMLFILLAMTFTRLLTITKTPRIMNQEFLPLIHNSIFLILFAIVMGSANPVQMLLFTIAAITTAVVTVFFRGKQALTVVTMLLIASGLGAWMTNQEFAQQAVFAAARTWELAQRVPNTLPILLLSIGPILFFVPFGLPRAFKQRDALRTLLIIWGLLSFVLFLSPIPKLLQLSPVRFLHPVPYASLAILSAEGLFQLSGILRRLSRNNIPLTTIHALLLALYLIFTVPSISRQFMDRITPAKNPQLLMDTIYNHVPAPIVEGLTWLRVTGRDPVMDRPVVLVDPAIPIEVVVPVFTGLPSFSGHPIHTLYPGVKEARRQEFFEGKMNPIEASQFLTDHRIGYIITKSPSRAPADYSEFVTMVYQNELLAIYKTGK